MNPEERSYLRRATRGLGARRGALEAELRGHLEARTAELRLAGHEEENARRLALRELGPPEPVGAGLRGVYVWPVARAGSLLGVLALGAIGGILHTSTVLAQVLPYRPTFTPLPGPQTYAELESVRRELAAAGLQLSPDGQTLSGAGVSAALPLDAENSIFVSRALVRDYASGQTFLDLNTLVRAALGAGLPARLEEGEPPVLRLGGGAVRLGTPGAPVEADNLYHLPLSPLAARLGLSGAWRSRLDDLSVGSRHTLTAPQAGVYALVAVWPTSPVRGSGEPPVLVFDVARAAAGGPLSFRLPYDLTDVALTGDPAPLAADASALRDRGLWPGYGSAARPAHGLLLRLTGALDGTGYEVVPQGGPSIGVQE